MASAHHRYRVEPVSVGTPGRLYRLTDRVGGLRVSVAPFAGAEIAGIQTRFQGRWREWLYRAGDYSPCDGWPGRAPWLFPAVGRSYTRQTLKRVLQTGVPPRQCDWEHRGAVYSMPMHGFVMHRPWRVVTTRADGDGAMVACELTDDQQTRRCYPFGFRLRLTALVADGELRTTMRVEAAANNPSVMPFCLGNHITVRAPLTGRGHFADVKLSGPADETNVPTPLGLAGKPERWGLRRGRPLSENRLHNLIVGPFAPSRAWMRMTDPSGLTIEVSQRELARGRPKASADTYHFVLWSDPKRKLFCPEPWLGLPNGLNDKRHAVQLKAGETFGWEMRVRVSSRAGSWPPT